ncbi:MAG: hypothetical protein ACOCRO_03645 [Halanaerobiales bacterium]
MSKFTHNPIIIPHKYTSTIVLSQPGYLKYKNKTNRKVDKFYIYKKRVVDDQVFLEIRSMRVNEFCQLLTDWNIDWKYYRFHTTYKQQ